MRLLLDTNRYRDLVDRDLAVTERVELAQSAWLSVVTLGELRAGFLRGSRRESNETRLGATLELQGFGVLRPDEETSHYYASVYDQLRSAGRMIPTNDIWIAAQALQHNLTLDTRDDHFRQVEGLRLVE